MSESGDTESVARGEDKNPNDGEVPEDARSDEIIIDSPAQPSQRTVWLRRGIMAFIAAIVVIAIILAITLNTTVTTDRKKTRLKTTALSGTTVIRIKCPTAIVRRKAVHNVAVNGPKIGLPQCSYPAKYLNYAVETVSIHSETYVLITLNHTNQSSGFASNIQRIRVDVKGVDDRVLRIKVSDANAQRWEVPIPLNLRRAHGPKSPAYDITAENSLLRITRKETGKVIFGTDLTKLIFADQFIQLTTNVSSAALYGFGERQAPHQKSLIGQNSSASQVFTFLNHDGVEGKSSYGSHPFYLMYEGTGEDRAHGVLLLNSNAMDVTFRTTPSLTYRTIGGVLDFLIFMGPTATEVLRQKARVIGQSPMPPYWALGFHLCRFGYKNSSQVAEAFANNTRVGVPIDTQWVDIDYMDNFNDFTYDKENFAGLPEFVKYLHSINRTFVPMLDPSLGYDETEVFRKGVADDVFVRDADGDILNTTVWNPVSVIPDFTNPKTEDWWRTNLQTFHSEVPYDGMWIDMNEPAATSHFGSLKGCTNGSLDRPQYNPNFPLELEHGTICMSARHHIGRHYNVHNLFSLFEGKVTYEALSKKVIPGKRPFVLSRATTTGQGQYTSHWLGDVSSSWQHLRSSIPAILDFNLFGIPLVGSDICGFNDNTTDELCARWTSLGSFYTFSRNHNSNSSLPQDPASMGPNVVAAAKKSLNTRYTFLPYLYTQFFHSSQKGDPVLRSLKLNFPEDEETNANEKQFMWGTGLLINPILEQGSTYLDAYFPAAVWYDYQTGHRLTNATAQNVTLEIQVTDINIALRGGHIFPLIPSQNMTTHDHRTAPFTLLAVLGEDESAAGDLYWDDGSKLNAPHQPANHVLVQFTVENSVLSVRVKGGRYNIENPVAEVDVWGVKKEVENVRLINGPKLSFSYVNGRLRAHLPPNTYLNDEFHVRWS